jgi:hypothetical protein
MAMRLFPLLFALAALAPSGAFAEHKCQCLYQGKRFEQGQLVCIKVDGTARLARCDMLLNNSSWKFLSNGCPTAALFTPVPAGRLPASPKVD